MLSIKEKLHAGDIVLGTWCVIPSSTTIEIIGLAGFDFLIIDMEHGPASFETAENLVRAAEISGVTPLLRVPENNESTILRGLEIGSGGIIVPQISFRDDAVKAVRAVKYSPQGTRGFSPFTRSSQYSPIDTASISKTQNEKTLSVLLVEGVEGISRLEEIVEVDNLDVVYIGTYDLSQSAGHPGEPNHPDVIKYLEESVKIIRDSGKAAGCLAQSIKDVQNWRNLGIQFIPYLADCSIFMNACRDIISEVKNG